MDVIDVDIASVALWQAQDENGLIASLEIETEDGNRTIVTIN